MTGPRIAGNALAAATAAVAASHLGVAGTVLGAALVSVGTTAGTAVYAHYLERTGEKVRQHTVKARRGQSCAGGGTDTLVPVEEAAPRRLPWARVAVAAGLVFALSMGGILTYQTVAGQTVAEQLTGKPARKTARAKPTPVKDKDAEPGYSARRVRTAVTPVASRSPDPSATPAVTATLTVTVSATPAVTAAPAPAGHPTPAPTATTAASGSPAPSAPAQSPAPTGSMPPPQHVEPGDRVRRPPATPDESARVRTAAAQEDEE
ncbi:hypothetical protein [Nonomuraea gerenzanensis]|uniref:Uncharacterized protein n=1 Tax=Nonomuraea gerenzanensis TaxID=93944 RepID=A0A1M4EE20_9ACTN|nr:hypothetical protein [Nonomuraea gerenzanensis]UBU08866.1 hypothetical protein LCN96_31290 [Nonomuraea gerenzanensis]SBO97231.1 hypothetical protein BN4615_P6747 [Nonomuraea gerenzanensis]